MIARWNQGIVAVLLALFVAVVSCERVLVVSDQPLDQYSAYLSTLKEHFTVDEQAIKSESLALAKFEARNYDHLIILPTKARSLGPRLTAKHLYEFLKLGGNILAVTSPSSVPEAVREFATEVDINIAPRGYNYVDYFSSEIPAEAFLNNEAVEFEMPIDLEGLEEKIGGAYLGNGELTFSVISGSSTGFLHDAREDDSTVQGVWASGKQVSLAAAFQSRGSSARFGWIASPELLNTYAGEELTKWVTKQKAVISVEYVKHDSLIDGQIDHSKDGRAFGENGPLLYSVNEDLTYTVALSELKDGKKVPFVPRSATQAPQVEFIMLDPYYRLKLEAVGESDNAALFSTNFTVPDQYGVFTLKTEYEHPGLSFFTTKDVVTVRHIANDEWPRSWEISNSWVYLTSHFAVVAAWFLFVLFFMYTKSSGPVSVTQPKVKESVKEKPSGSAKEKASN